MEPHPEPMQGPIDLSKVRAAFITAAVRQWNKHKGKHKWIPVTYWSGKVNKMLERDDISPTFLFCKALKGGIDREFTEDDRSTYKDIKIIKSNDRSFNNRRHVFLQVVFKLNQLETIPTNQKDANAFFIRRYAEYNARKRTLPPPQLPPPRRRQAPRTVTPTEFEDASSSSTRVQEEVTQRVQEETTMAHEPTAKRTETTTESQPTMIERKRTGPFGTLRDLLSKFIHPQYVDEEDFFVSTPEEAIDAIKAFAADKVNKHHEIFDNGHGGDNDLATKVRDPSTFLPCFSKYGLPFRLSVINDLLHCMVKLSEEVPDVLHLMKQSGSKGLGRRLIAVVPCADNSPANFNQNAKQWMPSLFSALGIGEEDKYFACFHMLNLLRVECTEAFEDLCRTKSTMVSEFKMDPLRQIAMFSECNITYNQGRTMRKFFIADKCNPLHSERAIRKLEVLPNVIPICSTFQEHKMKRNAWFLPVDEAVIAMLKEREDSTEVSELHAILSADHGQGAFRINVTVLLLADGKIVFEKHLLVGHIECKNDTARVLVDSGVIKGINESLGRLKCCPESIPFPVKLLAVGDLAWYSLALGKEKMSGWHCFRCKAMATAFKHDPSIRAEVWTLPAMREQHARLVRGEIKKTKTQTLAQLVHGVIQPMLIDCIEPTDYLSPVLHALTLLANTPFKYLRRYIWYRMDEIPVELMMVQENATREVIKLEACWEDCLEADAEYNDLKMKVAELKPRNRRKDPFDSPEHRSQYDAAVLEVADFKSEVARIKKVYEDQGKEVTKAKEKVSKMEKNHKKYGKVTRDLWMSIERMLKADFNVYASTYHGGDMEGNQCRNLMRMAPLIMAKIKDILLEYRDSLTPEQQARRASPEEIQVYCQCFERLFQYMDVMSHYCYQPFGSISDDDLEDAKRAVDLGMSMWHKLMPTIPMKVHVWHHLKEDLEKYRGLESHHEQQVERAHQIGKKNERRLGAVKDFEKKTMVILKHNQTTSSNGVQAKIDDTYKQSKGRNRKRKIADVDEDPKAERAAYLKSILQLPELTNKFDTLRKLQVDTYRQQHEEEGGVATEDAIVD
jgi:hypothetical protein